MQHYAGFHRSRRNFHSNAAHRNNYGAGLAAAHDTPVSIIRRCSAGSSCATSYVRTNSSETSTRALDQYSLTPYKTVPFQCLRRLSLLSCSLCPTSIFRVPFSSWRVCRETDIRDTRPLGVGPPRVLVLRRNCTARPELLPLALQHLYGIDP